MPYGTNQPPSAVAAVRPSLDSLARAQLLPTPTVADSRSSANATAGRSVPLVGHAGRTLTDAARLLPTPRTTDGSKGCRSQRASHGGLTLPSAAVRRRQPDGTGHEANAGEAPDREPESIAGPAAPQLGMPDEARWGEYAVAVARWETLLGRPVPDPSQPGRHGKPVLAPPFVEWLMGLPELWVTDPQLGLPRTRALRVLGNGVVPQQATAALCLLLDTDHWDPVRSAVPA
ncbi:hypothetical protein [Dactylosporangium matsuzakiense]|uniref:DNA (Cytosine-5)-methyltransferase 1 n=1 Tax=Dactylosporangium matsuzakiense TaxID=53360 RepID=A0A9W6KMB9_9ACTN|nr:hypothetical protein [Dactylosporangium matsuzakiense]GLL04682.1 hypothetical protein GCM10017581_064290 [Dactylosporangium matsuzakiense]